ncbi:MAG TPA: ASCH domain-containing protein [Thermoanaerobaculia bacterium]|nr:ASCH domain-containing protein [Thermoanaerobaculia bacterium]
MLFTKYLRDGVRSGAITRSVRVWMRPHVRTGRRYQFEEGEIQIDSIVPITSEQITPHLARQCGFASVTDLLKVARHGPGENVYLIEFHYIAPKGNRL